MYAKCVVNLQQRDGDMREVREISICVALLLDNIYKGYVAAQLPCQLLHSIKERVRFPVRPETTIL